MTAACTLRITTKTINDKTYSACTCPARVLAGWVVLAARLHLSLLLLLGLAMLASATLAARALRCTAGSMSLVF